MLTPAASAMLIELSVLRPAHLSLCTSISGPQWTSGTQHSLTHSLLEGQLLFLTTPASGRVAARYLRHTRAGRTNVITFVEALGIKQIDLLSFLMGGCCVQMVALTAPWLVRKSILAGTRASQGPTMDTNSMHPGPLALLSSSNTPEDIEKSIAESFYYWTDEGRAAAKASWERIHERAHDRFAVS